MGLDQTLEVSDSEIWICSFYDRSTQCSTEVRLSALMLVEGSNDSSTPFMSRTATSADNLRIDPATGVVQERDSGMPFSADTVPPDYAVRPLRVLHLIPRPPFAANFLSVSGPIVGRDSDLLSGYWIELLPISIVRHGSQLWEDALGLVAVGCGQREKRKREDHARIVDRRRSSRI